MPTRKLVVEIIGNADSLERSFARASKSSQGFERSIGRAGRGALTASVGFRGLGRAAAFASVPFVGAAGVTELLKTSVEQAETAAKAHASLAAALKQTGENARKQLPQIDAWARSQAEFGVSANTAVTGLARLVELTGSAKTATEGYTAALEISKATGKDFNAVSLAVGKALNGQTGALARYIGAIPKATSNTELLARVSERYGGQARANTLATDRLHAEVSDLETTLGTALLPTIDKVTGSLADWLGKSQNQAKIQRDITTAVDDATKAFGAIRAAVNEVDRVTGSFTHTLELLLALKVASTATGWARSLNTLRQPTIGATASTNKLGAALGNAGLVAEAGLASFALTSLILKLTGADKALKKAGASAFDFAASLGLAQGAPTIAPTQKQSLRAISSARLAIERGVAPSTELATLQRQFPKLTQHDLQVFVATAVRQARADQRLSSTRRRQSERPVEVVVNLDGREVARNTTKHQRQASTRRAVSRSGPYAGRN